MTDLASRVSAAPWLIAAVRGLPPHRGVQSFAQLCRIGSPQRALHLNESPYPPSPRALEAARAALADLNRYPDSRAEALSAALEARTGVPAARIVYGVGSDELIQVVAEMTLGPGDRCVMPAPSFPRYSISTRLQGATPVGAPLDPDGACDAQSLLAAIGPRTPVVFACTPNAPTGGMMAQSALRRLAAEVPATTLLVVDEAYHEFARQAGGPDVLATLAERRGPWVVLRTFSKAYCLAGMRLGYALCGSDVEAEAMRRAKLQYNVTAMAQAAAHAALEDEPYLAATLAAVAAERQRLADGLAALRLRVYRSVANFVSADLGRPALPIMAALGRRGVHVRDWRDPEHPTKLRITVGTAEDTDAVLAALRETLQALHP